VALELLQDQPATVGIYPSTLASRPSSATLSFKSPGGTEKAAPSVTVAAVSATVTSVASQVTFDVSSTTGIAAGAQVWMVTAGGWEGAVTVSELASSTVTLVSAPPGTVDTAATIYGLELSATIPLSATGTRDRFYQLFWTVTSADSSVSLHHQIAHVVRMQFADPVTDTEAKRYVSANWPGLAASKDAGFFRGVALRTNQRIRNLIQATGDFPHMIGDPDLFKASGAGLAALRVELAHLSLVPGDFEPLEYIASTERDLTRGIREAMANAYVDRDDTGSNTSGDVQGMFTVRAVRR